MILSDMSFKDIQAEIGISPSTWDVCFWRNTQGFRDFIKDCQDERLRDLARKNILEAVEMPIPNTDDPRWHKIKTDTSQFILETLEKDRYSKKIDDNKDDRTPINIAVNTYKRIENYKKGLPKPKEA
jgi:hypothetical protein